MTEMIDTGRHADLVMTTRFGLGYVQLYQTERPEAFFTAAMNRMVHICL